MDAIFHFLLSMIFIPSRTSPENNRRNRSKRTARRSSPICQWSAARLWPRPRPCGNLPFPALIQLNEAVGSRCVDGCNSDSSRAKYDGVFSFACKRAPRCPAAYCKRLDQAGGFGRNGIWNFIGLFSQFCVRDQYIFGKAAPPPCTLGISLREDRVGVHAVPTRISFTFLPTWTTSETISCPKSPPIVTLWPRCSAHTDKPLHRFHRCYLNGFL